jgi:hypothetical protein
MTDAQLSVHVLVLTSALFRPPVHQSGFLAPHYSCTSFARKSVDSRLHSYTKERCGYKSGIEQVFTQVRQ